MGRNIKSAHLNEDFFNQDSIIVWYLLGALVKTYIPLKGSNRTIIFRNRSYKLIEILRESLECKNSIVSDNRGKNSHFLTVSNERLFLNLEQRGLTPDKGDRRFPEDIPPEFMNDYVRGFIENECFGKPGEITAKLDLYFNHEYLAGLNEALRRYCGVEKKSVTGDHIEYGITDLTTVYNFIYGDGERFHLPEIKEKFKLIDSYFIKLKERRDNKAEKAKILLREGKNGIETSRILGYKSEISFYTFFRKHTGVGIREFKTGYQ